MLKKLRGVGIIILLICLLIKPSRAVYWPSEEGLGVERIREAENYGKTHLDLMLYEDKDVELLTNRRILEEKHRRQYNWWKIAKTEWGTVGIPTMMYLGWIDANIKEFPVSSAVILTPFLMAASLVSSVEGSKEKFEELDKEEPLFAEEEAIRAEMGPKYGELVPYYAWSFHMPFVIWSEKKFPVTARYVLRYYPEEYYLEKGEAEAVYVVSRESRISENENAGFFYYVAFPTLKILKLEDGIGPSLNDQGTEATGLMVLMVITEAGEEWIFPFDLSKIR